MTETGKKDFPAPVWEAAHADTDSLKHAVASELFFSVNFLVHCTFDKREVVAYLHLVHDEGAFHLPRLLVGVRHQATDEVGFAGVL